MAFKGNSVKSYMWDQGKLRKDKKKPTHQNKQKKTLKENKNTACTYKMFIPDIKLGRLNLD